MEFERTYFGENGTEITIKMKARCSNHAEIDEALQLIYDCSDLFYLDALEALETAAESTQ